MLNNMRDLYESEYEAEFEFEFEDGDDEYEFESEFETPGPFDETEEMDLAAELLTVSGDEELEYFLGKLVRRAARGVSRFARSKAGKAVGGILRNVAKKALPVAGAALGNAIVPGVGGIVGGKLASAAGRAFGLELEGMSPEDQEFEVARRFVRLAGETTQNAARALSGPPKVVAKRALVAASRKHAPGLVQVSQRIQTGSRSPAGAARRGASRTGGSRNASSPDARTGRWVRRGHRLIVMGA